MLTKKKKKTRTTIQWQEEEKYSFYLTTGREVKK